MTSRLPNHGYDQVYGLWISCGVEARSERDNQMSIEPGPGIIHRLNQLCFLGGTGASWNRRNENQPSVDLQTLYAQFIRFL